MKIFAILLLIVSSIITFYNCLGQDESELKTVLKGNVSFTTRYCGGARPSQEILDRNKTSKIYKNTTFKLINSSNNKEYLFKTDSLGNFSLTIKKGMYNLYPTLIFSDENKIGFDHKCEKWQVTNIGEITIGNIKNINHNFIVNCPCDPCDPDIKKRQ